MLCQLPTTDLKDVMILVRKKANGKNIDLSSKGAKGIGFNSILKEVKSNQLQKRAIPTEERELKFYNDIARFVGKIDGMNRDDFREFYNYWIEKGDNDKKMRFEKESTFGLKRRLSTWKTNKSKFNTKGKEEKPSTGSNIKLHPDLT